MILRTELVQIVGAHPKKCTILVLLRFVST